MIEVVVPTSTQDFYLGAGLSMVGPLSVILGDLRNQTSGELTVGETFVESPGLGGDNNIDHSQVDGKITWCSLLASAIYTANSISTPTWQCGKATLRNLITSAKSSYASVEIPAALIGSSGYDCLLSYNGKDPKSYVTAATHEGFRVEGTTIIHCRLGVQFGGSNEGPQRVKYFKKMIIDLSTREKPKYGDPTYAFNVHEYSIEPTIPVLLPDIWTKGQSLEVLLEQESLIPGSTKSGRTSFTEWSYNGTVQAPPFGVVSNLVKDAVQNLVLEANCPEFYDYGDLAFEASKNARSCQTNIISFVRDLRHPLEMIPKLKNLKSLKGLANNYLTVKYGVMPTISDLEDIKAAFSKVAFYDKSGNRALTAGHTTSYESFCESQTLVQHIKIAIAQEDSVLQGLYQRFCDVGVFPTLSNIWDLVPYSFVLDWFVDVGELLEKVDTRLLFSTMNIAYVTKSSKLTSKIRFTPSIVTPLIGSITRVHYHRWVSDQCPVPPLVLNSTIQDFDHWVETGALVIQRKH